MRIRRLIQEGNTTLVIEKIERIEKWVEETLKEIEGLDRPYYKLGVAEGTLRIIREEL